MTGLTDACMHRYTHMIRRSLHGTLDTEVEEDLITCGHSSNSYTVSQSKSTSTSIRDIVTKPTGKRIDFILYKLLQNATTTAVPVGEQHHMCLADRVHCEGKDPVTGMSFSDHQPVIVKLVIKRKDLALKHLEELKNGTSEIVVKNGQTVQKNGVNCTPKPPNSAGNHSDESEVSIDEDDTFTGSGENGPAKHKDSNVFLDVISGQKNGFSETTVTSKSETIKGDDQDTEEYLKECYLHLRKYLEVNYTSKQKTLLVILLLVSSLVCAAIGTSYIWSTSSVTLFYWWVASVVVGCVLVVVNEFVYRLEHTAIKGIAEEMACVLGLTTSNGDSNGGGDRK